jgi:hypothetical protein
LPMVEIVARFRPSPSSGRAQFKPSLATYWPSGILFKCTI